MNFAKFTVLSPLTACLLFLASPLSSFGQQDDIFNLWYGDGQSFGKTGTVQRFVNILGNLNRDMDFTNLSFKHNNSSSQYLTIGSDQRRLKRKGDFNIEIPIKQLVLGKNTVELEAIDSTGKVYSDTFDFYWSPQPTVPDKVIKWNEISNINEAAQPIDGLWKIEGDKIILEPETVGYDRAVGFGDMSWRDYEVLFPFEVRNLDTSAYGTEISVNPAILYTMGWKGHTDYPEKCPQPHCGWSPYGSISSVSWPENKTGSMSLSTLWGGKSEIILKEDSPLLLNEKYWFRGRNETTGAGNFYSFKIWHGELENEPKDWTAKSLAEPTNMESGSFLLVAHHVDLAIGNMEFMPLAVVKQKIKYTLVNHTDTLVQLPYLALWVIGILWALVYIKRDPHRGKWILISFVLNLVCSLISIILLENLPEHLQNEGWASEHITYSYVLIRGIAIGGHVIAWAILFKMLLPPKNKS